MQKIIMLGTGHGFVYHYYNTCFLMQNDSEYLLVDTGGGVQIVERLEQLNISLTDVHEIFISHSHTDHILGLFWLLKKITGMVKKGNYQGKLNIYCNDEVGLAIKSIYPHLFPKAYMEMIDSYLNIIVVEDNETKKIAGKEYTFFDVKARGNKLYGFETVLDNGKRFVFLGDETCNPEVYNRIENCEYVMHEAFCLEDEQDIFKPYEKRHSTVKSVCENFESLNIENLILFHTEDTHIDNRKELYLREGKEYFHGNIIVPDELEEILLVEDDRK